MKKIDISKLQKGDIILTTAKKIMSFGIRLFTWSDISHAMIYVAHGSVMDSTGDGVCARNIEKTLYPDACSIHVFRLKKTLSDSELRRVINYVRSETAAPYDTTEAMLSLFKPDKEGGKNQFCSRLVARAYASVGVYLHEKPDHCTPGDIQRSELVEEVEGVVISLSDAEVEAAQAIPDTTIGYREVQKKLMSMIRAHKSSVRTENDIIAALIKNPELDDVFEKAYRESGYLTYWRVDVERFPFRYNIVGLAQLYHSASNKDEVIEYARRVVHDDAAGQYDHWKTCSSELNELSRKFALKTIRQLAETYMQICFYHRLRVEAAKALLHVYGERHPVR